MTETERRQIIALVKSEVIPAIGCTEPIAVALCVATVSYTHLSTTWSLRTVSHGARCRYSLDKTVQVSFDFSIMVKLTIF